MLRWFPRGGGSSTPIRQRENAYAASCLPASHHPILHGRVRLDVLSLRSHIASSVGERGCLVPVGDCCLRYCLRFVWIHRATHFRACLKPDSAVGAGFNSAYAMANGTHHPLRLGRIDGFVWICSAEPWCPFNFRLFIIWRRTAPAVALATGSRSNRI
jgi:hypothetical protein